MRMEGTSLLQLNKMPENRRISALTTNYSFFLICVPAGLASGMGGNDENIYFGSSDVFRFFASG
jgi:hypothetical protein